MATPPGKPDHIDIEDVDWREALLRRMTGIAIALVVLVALATLAGSHSALMRGFSIGMLGYAALLGPLLLLSKISVRTRSIILAGSFALASALTYLAMGFLAGPALTVAFAMVVAGLLLGRTVFIGMVVAFSVFLVVLGTLVATGVWPGPNPADLDPGNPVNWVRTGAVTIAMWTGLGFSILYVVNTIEENLARRQAALIRLQEETAERLAAEKARRDAETVANEAQKMDAVGQLAAGIAHDVNNALLVIRGWNEIRGKQDSDETQQEATRAIERAAEHTAQLSRQLLTFARKDIRNARPLHLEELVADTVRTLRNVVGSKIDLSLESKGQNVVHADESQIQQLLFNLVINARDAVDGAGVVRLSVETPSSGELGAFDSEGRDWVVLRVQDNGPGIEKAAQKRVFEPFFTTKPQGEGTGLGLSTVLGIVQQSEGHVDLESQPGRTVFSIFLPANNEEAVESVSAPEADSSISIQHAERNLRILVLEDDPLALQMFASWLTHDGHEVVECGDGSAALSLLGDDAAPFDLLCSDAVFPGATLESVLDAFEQHSPDGKILVCSGYVPDELAISKLESGEYAFLPKPFSGSDLLSRIHEIVSPVSKGD